MLINKGNFIMKTLSKVIAATVLSVFAAVSFAKDTEIWVPYPAGGITGKGGVAAQMLMRENTNDAIDMNYVPGAGGKLGLKKWWAEPASDDKINLVVSNETILMSAYLTGDLPVDMIETGVKPVFVIGSTGLLVHASPKLDVKTWQDFDRLGKDKLNVGSMGKGSFTHLMVLTLQKYIKTPLNVVVYNSAPKLMNDVAGGHLDIGLGFDITSQGFAKKGLTTAVLSTHGFAGMPDVPSFAEAFGPDEKVPTKTTFAMFARADADPADIKYVRGLITKGFRSWVNENEYRTNFFIPGYIYNQAEIDAWWENHKKFFREAQNDPAYAALKEKE